MDPCTTNILDLPDDCLEKIFKYLPKRKMRNRFAATCDRFAQIYCDYYKHELIMKGHDLTVFDKNTYRIFGRFMHKDFSPLNNLKTIKLNAFSVKSFSPIFLNCIRRDYHSIEIFELTGFTDNEMEYLMPLPNVKSLTLSSCDVSGDLMENSQKLEELILDSVSKFHSVFLLKIVKNNNLRKLIVRGSPLALAPHFVEKIIPFLNNLVEFECSWYEINFCCGAIGKLPQLKILILNDFKTMQCTKCEKLDNDGLRLTPKYASPYWECECGVYDAVPLFKGLCQKNILESLTLIGSSITERDIFYIGRLKRLKKIHISVEKVPSLISLKDFHFMPNLEELDLSYSYKRPVEVLILLKRCQNLKFLNIGNCCRYTQAFLYSIIEVIKERGIPHKEPIKVQLMNPEINNSFLKHRDMVAASEIVSFEIIKKFQYLSRYNSSVHYMN